MNNLQTLLDQAAPNAVIVLEAGDYVGNFTISKPVTIKGAGVKPSRRVAPGEPRTRIVSPNNAPALLFEQGVRDCVVEFVEITSPVYCYDLIRIGSLAETDPAKQPKNLLFDRIYLHGDAVVGAKRGAMISGSGVTFQNCHVSDFKGNGQDAMGFAVCNSPEPGNLKWINNYISGAGYGIILGGCSFKIADALPSDFEVRGNHFFKPLAWQSENWVVKNHFEIKNGRRGIIEGNIFENCWADGQIGFTILFTTKPGGIHADGTLFSEISDVMFRNNLVLNSTCGINISSGEGVLRNVIVENNRFVDVPNRLFQVLGNMDGLKLLANTALETATAAIVTSGVGKQAINAVVSKNALALGSVGVKGSGLASGNKTIESYFPGSIFTENALLGGLPANYPPGNVFELLPGYGVDEARLQAAIVNTRSGEIVAEVPTEPPAEDLTDSQVLREMYRLIKDLAAR